MPLNDFFSYQIDRNDNGTILARVSIQAKHPLFKGHFPGQPVTPGVALIEIIRQVISSALKKKLMLTEAREIKFISAIIPTEITDLDLSIEYTVSDGKINTSCIISGNGKVFSKLKGDFSEE
jgi:3-hydroxyacyl-[acyl-carrier-protein] dehydratase